MVSVQPIDTFNRGEARLAETFAAGDFFQIPPYVSHAMTFDEDSVLVALYDIPVETTDGGKIFMRRECKPAFLHLEKQNMTSKGDFPYE